MAVSERIYKQVCVQEMRSRNYQDSVMAKVAPAINRALCTMVVRLAHHHSAARDARYACMTGDVFEG